VAESLTTRRPSPSARRVLWILVLAPTITHAALNGPAVVGGLVVARWLQG
jgi:hypothetical protein